MAEEEEKEIQTDVDDMLGDLIGDSSAETDEGGSDDGEDEGTSGEGREEEDDEEEGDKDDESEDEDKEEDSGTGEEEEEESGGDEGAEESDGDEEEEDKDAVIAALRKQIAGEDSEEEGGEIEEEEEPEEFSVLGNEDLATVLDDPDKFNAVMGKALEGFGNLMMKKFLTSIPSVVMHQVKQQSVIRSAVTAFYDENKDLDGYRKLVGATINEVVAENPDWKMDKVFETAADKTRKVLGLKKIAQSSKKKKKNPSFAKPKGKSGKSEVSKPSKLQKDIDNLLVE